MTAPMCVLLTAGPAAGKTSLMAQLVVLNSRDDAPLLLHAAATSD